MIQMAGNALAIPERRYHTGPTVRFTTFTTCIGILSMVSGQNNVIGIHLSLRDAQDNIFNRVNALAVAHLLQQLNYDQATTKIVGHIQLWENNAGFRQLLHSLGLTANHARVFRLTDGTYGGTAGDGEVDLTY